MITLFYRRLYFLPKGRAWLLNHEVPFQAYIMTSPLSAPELQHILSLTENGTDDIISTRSKFSKLDLDVEDLSISTLIHVVRKIPVFCVAQLF